MPQKELLVRIGSKIKKVRSERKLTQYELAVLCEFEKASMSRLEAGKTNVTILTLYKISKVLDVHISVFFSEKD